jgi:hypothetical protein
MKASLSFSKILGLSKETPKAAPAPVVVQQPVVQAPVVVQEAPPRKVSFPKTAVPAPAVTAAPERWTITVGDDQESLSQSLIQWCDAVSKGTTKDVTKMLKSGEIKVDAEINKVSHKLHNPLFPSLTKYFVLPK